MSELKLTENGIEALISSAVGGACILALLSFTQYGQLLAFLFGTILLFFGLYSIYLSVDDHSENIVFKGIIIMFGLIFEFGALTDIVNILPIAIVIDVSIIVVSSVASAIGIALPRW